MITYTEYLQKPVFCPVPGHNKAASACRGENHELSKIVVPREMLERMTDDPSTGGPYVMWEDTPYAHIMVPVGAE